MPELLTLGYVDVDFHGCRHGGSRARWCRWRVLGCFLNSLAGECTKDHPHKPWKMEHIDGKWVFPTAEEAAYPKVLADRVALLLSQHLNLELPFNDSLLNTEKTAALEAVNAGKQPRGTKIKPLVSEFKEVVKRKRPDIPSESKILRIPARNSIGV